MGFKVQLKVRDVLNKAKTRQDIRIMESLRLEMTSKIIHAVSLEGVLFLKDQGFKRRGQKFHFLAFSLKFLGVHWQK